MNFTCQTKSPYALRLLMKYMSNEDYIDRITLYFTQTGIYCSHLLDDGSTISFHLKSEQFDIYTLAGDKPFRVSIYPTRLYAILKEIQRKDKTTISIYSSQRILSVSYGTVSQKLQIGETKYLTSEESLSLTSAVNDVSTIQSKTAIRNTMTTTDFQNAIKLFTNSSPDLLLRGTIEGKVVCILKSNYTSIRIHMSAQEEKDKSSVKREYQLGETDWWDYIKPLQELSTLSKDLLFCFDTDLSIILPIATLGHIILRMKQSTEESDSESDIEDEPSFAQTPSKSEPPESPKENEDDGCVIQ